MAKLSQRKCAVEGCTRPYECKGYCALHYVRWRKGADLLAPPLRGGEPRLCEVPGCDRRHMANGLCQLHYTRKRRGLPLEHQPVVDLPGERWRDVPGLESFYQASSLGRLKSLDRIVIRENGVRHPHTGMLLNPTISHGYLKVNITMLSSSFVFVHRLVAAAFLGPRPEGYDVNHINGRKDDNRAANLEYATRSQNHRHAYRTGLRVSTPLQGERHPMVKLTEGQVRYVRSMRGRKRTAALADELGCSRHTIWSIQTGRSWSHLD